MIKAKAPSKKLGLVRSSHIEQNKNFFKAYAITNYRTHEGQFELEDFATRRKRNIFERRVVGRQIKDMP
jgi:hypothetical protein